jgi:para-nitrobenzyl esterase
VTNAPASEILRRLAALLGVIGTLAAGAAGSQDAGEHPVVRVADGALRGATADGVSAFKGVPFAAPPVGALRWREPQPVAPWSGVREALAFGAPCAQAAFAWNRNVAEKSAEDCLYLNVWAPARPRGSAPLPVMVFFPGGAFHGGSAAGSSMIEPSYDGARLARRGVVVVTVNYRLGMFGFLALPALSAESPHNVSGNYALLDQIAALAWVRANIGAFGGDPANVTAMGQSAGSASVALLMTSPLARGLFQKAILDSGTVVDHEVGVDALKTAEAKGSAFIQELPGGATGGIDALRRQPASALLTAMLARPDLSRAEPHRPDLDGYVLARQPALVFQAGREASIPLIVGATARDGDGDSMGVKGTPKAQAAAADPARRLASTHAVASLSAQDATEVRDYYARYPDLAAVAARLYADPAAVDPVDGDAAIAFATDTDRRCGPVLIAAWHGRAAPAWRFEFSHGYEPLGAVHLWDLMYLFGWLEPPADQPRDWRLSDQLQAYWANFARTGDPNGPGLPAWPQSREHEAYLDFASGGARAAVGPRQAACDLHTQRIERDLQALKGKGGAE